MTAKVKKSPDTNTNKDAIVSVQNTMLGATEPLLKGIALYSAAHLMSQPHFATQVNQTTIIELTDLMFKYLTGQVQVVPTQPTKVANTEATFG